MRGFPPSSSHIFASAHSLLVHSFPCLIARECSGRFPGGRKRAPGVGGAARSCHIIVPGFTGAGKTAPHDCSQVRLLDRPAPPRVRPPYRSHFSLRRRLMTTREVPRVPLQANNRNPSGLRLTRAASGKAGEWWLLIASSVLVSVTGGCLPHGPTVGRRIPRFSVPSMVGTANQRWNDGAPVWRRCRPAWVGLGRPPGAHRIACSDCDQHGGKGLFIHPRFPRIDLCEDPTQKWALDIGRAVAPEPSLHVVLVQSIRDATACCRNRD